MTGALSISSIFIKSHNSKITNLKTLFAQGFNIKTVDYNLINKFVIYRLNQYPALNAKDYYLWNCIQMNFKKFEAKHFDNIVSRTWTITRDYCYLYRY